MYEAPFKTKCHQCFRNLYRTSNIYIGRPISISDTRVPMTSGHLYPTSGYQYPTSGYLYPTSWYLYPTSGYLYPTSDIYILDVQYLYPTSDVQYPTSASARARARAGIGQGYQTSDIYI